MKLLRCPLLLALLGLGLFACRQQAQKPAAAKPPTEAEQRAKLDQLQLAISEPVRIDSSVYVMFPLQLASAEEDREAGGSFSSYKGRSAAACWNIIFYNTSTGKYHLLDEQRKMVIYSYRPNDEAGASAQSVTTTGAGSGYSQVGELLYYSVTTEDFNRDGQLGPDDPQYLFVSDKAGRRFEQISPGGLHVRSWELVRGVNKVLIHAQRDSNNDRRFDDRDEVVPLVYTLGTKKPAGRLFDRDFLLKIKKQLQAQWRKPQ